jgi:hypothetical protein
VAILQFKHLTKGQKMANATSGIAQFEVAKNIQQAAAQIEAGIAYLQSINDRIAASKFAFSSGGNLNDSLQDAQAIQLGFNGSSTAVQYMTDALVAAASVYATGDYDNLVAAAAGVTA